MPEYREDLERFAATRMQYVLPEDPDHRIASDSYKK